jgi:hypothetical protein
LRISILNLTDEDNPVDEISGIKARLEELAEVSERCRKIISPRQTNQGFDASAPKNSENPMSEFLMIGLHHGLTSVLRVVDSLRTT